MYDALQMKTQRPAIMKCKKLYKRKCSDPSTMDITNKAMLQVATKCINYFVLP